MRWSSVWLVLSAGCACQASGAVAVFGFIVDSSGRIGHKKTAGVRRFF
jgi:hypothetical protein